jgi:rhomboid protease GluP
MSVRRCATCGKEFELRFGDTRFTDKCPTCDLQRWEGGQASPSPAADSGTTSIFPLTIALIGVNVLVFVVMVASGVSAFLPTPKDAIAFGADFGPLTLGGQWWRLVTSMFVHFGFIHLGLNMWCLWNLGRAAEQLMGRIPYLLAYFASGIFGSIASVYWHPLAAGAGASGAIFGMAGVLVSFVYLKKTPAHLQINSRMLGSLGTFIFYNLVYGAAIPGISNAAHVGGLVMGLAFGALLPSATAPELARRTRLSVAILVTAAALVASAVTVKRLRAGTGELASIQKLVVERKSDEAFSRLKELTAREPQLAPAQALLASMYFRKSQFLEGISALKKANEADPGNAEYQQQLGGAYLTTGKLGEAQAVYRKLVHEHPSDLRNYLGLGFADMGLQQYDAAIAEFREAVSLDPKSAQAEHALGQAQLRAGRFDDAEKTYEQLLKQFPNDAGAQAALDYAKRQPR